MGLWQPSQWRENCTPFSAMSMFTFFRYQGCAKAVGVNGLAPLVVCLLVAVAAVFGGENACAD